MFAKDDLVRIKFTTLEGVVTGAALDDNGVLYNRVAFADANGDPQERTFLPSQLEPR